MTILYFTSTGNCFYVAKRIGGTLYSIPQLMKTNNLNLKDDVIGLIFPTYGFGMPKIVKKFLEQAVLEADYTFAIATYGNMTGAVLDQLEKAAASRGMKFDYMNTLLMVDNYLPGFKMEDQLAKLPEKKIEENLSLIIEDIKNKKRNIPSPSFVQKISTSIIQTGVKVLLSEKKAQSYIVNDNCTKCGICTKVCPTGNIEVRHNVKFHDRCEYCLGCVNLCPQNAIHLKNEKSTERFKNENVSLKEIIDSNCQID